MTTCPDGLQVERELAFLVCCAHQMATFPVPDKGVGAREGRYVLKVSLLAVAINKNNISVVSQPTDLGRHDRDECERTSPGPRRATHS